MKVFGYLSILKQLHVWSVVNKNLLACIFFHYPFKLQGTYAINIICCPREHSLQFTNQLRNLLPECLKFSTLAQTVMTFSHLMLDLIILLKFHIAPHLITSLQFLQGFIPPTSFNTSCLATLIQYQVS